MQESPTVTTFGHPSYYKQSRNNISVDFMAACRLIFNDLLVVIIVLVIIYASAAMQTTQGCNGSLMIKIISTVCLPDIFNARHNIQRRGQGDLILFSLWLAW